jgi:hypothetical protein
MKCNNYVVGITLLFSILRTHKIVSQQLYFEFEVRTYSV